MHSCEAGWHRSCGLDECGMLYLFSSNAEPQYAQDILNLLAAPNGYKMTLRYDIKHVSEEASGAWGQQLKDHDVLIHFVLQQKNRYFTPVLFPVRQGKVVVARREGDLHLVDYIVGNFVSLKDPTVITASVKDGRDTFYDYPERTSDYRKVLEDHRLPLPYDKYAILDDYNAVTDCDASGLVLGDPPSSATEIFRSITKYLVKTETFAEARFAYVSRLYQRGLAKNQQIDATSYGYKLTAGQEYELEFLQAQPELVATTTVMNVVIDGKALQAIGPSEFSIGSRYDLQSIRIAALPTASVQYTTIGLRPGDGVQGPVLDIPVEIRPPRAKNAAIAAGTAAGLILLGLSSIFTGFSGWAKFGLIAGGALLASFLNTFGLSAKSL
jgi:hypothetical protein